MDFIDWIGFTACSGVILRFIAEPFRDILVDLREDLQDKLDDKVDEVKGYIEKKKGEEFKIKV